MTPTLSDGDNPILRKVQLTGGSTFTVSLPKDWARDHGLDAGSTLYLYALQDRLVAAPTERSETRRSARVAADDLDVDGIEREIRAAYTAGSNTVRVVADGSLSTANARAASRAFAGLVGMEISGQTDDAVEGRSLLDTAEVSLEQTVVQIRQLALSMHRDAIEAVVADDTDLADTVAGRADDVDRLFALVSRQFHAALVDVTEIDRLGMDRTAAFRHYRTARGLERVADHAAGIASVASRQSGPPAADVADRLRDLGHDARDVVDISLDGDSDAAAAGREAVEAASKAFDRELYDSDEPDASLYGRVLERLRQTAEHGASIAVADLQAGFVRSDDA